MIFNVLPSIDACYYYNPKRINLCLALYDLCFQRYLVELVLAQQPLPRRQEAESLEFTSGGITQSALVTHEEVQEWATGSRKAIMCSISHAWETREHPDPCRQGTGLLWILFSSASLEPGYKPPLCSKKGGGHKNVGVSKTLRCVSQRKLARKQHTGISTRKPALWPRKGCVSGGVSNSLRPCEMKDLFSTAHFVWNTSLPLFPTVVSTKEWLLFPWIVLSPFVFSCLLRML